jgi:hypothetical protein
MESSVLGNVPNRGFDKQADVELTGIPYQQTISDHLNEVTGKADLVRDKINLHFEQGLFMRTPEPEKKTTEEIASKPQNGATPKKKFTISRMGTVPHGTTFNAQAFEPELVIGSKAPKFDDTDITPFFIPKELFEPKKPGPDFKNMQDVPEVRASDDKKSPLRIPVSVEKFKDTFTLAHVKNPNKILNEMNEGKTFKDHVMFTVKTDNRTQVKDGNNNSKTENKLPGGGVANIAFLEGGGQSPDGAQRITNAKVFNVECTYVVSSVVHTITIKPDDYSQGDPIFAADNEKDGVLGPRFQVEIRGKIKKEQTITVTSSQIQYSQNVRLDFGPLAWPHISVATLVPALPILVPMNSPVLANLEVVDRTKA